MKKYLFMLLAATSLSLGFTSCGDDEKEEPVIDPVVIDFDDYSSTVGMTLQAMMNKYGEPTYNFLNYYLYELKGGKTTGLTMVINPENNTVYGLMQSLAEDAYKPGDVLDYLASKYVSYGTRTETEVNEDTEETYTYTIHVFGNTQKEEDATLVIEYDGELEVDYYNPKNEPAEVNPGVAFETITPLEVVDQFLGEDIEDILDQYNNLMENNGMYMAFMDENELLMGFALNTEERIVTSIVLLYNEDLSDEDIIDYYTKAGYTCTDTGEVDEDEETPIYVFTNPNTGIFITYSGLRGVATQLPL